MLGSFFDKFFKKIPPLNKPDNGLEQPDVILDFIFEEGLFFISLQNITATPATDISVEFDQKITGINKQDFTALPLFKNLAFLAPYKEISTFLDTSNSYFNRNEPTEILTIISFSDMHGASHKNTIKHNLNIYKDVRYPHLRQYHRK